MGMRNLFACEVILSRHIVTGEGVGYCLMPTSYNICRKSITSLSCAKINYNLYSAGRQWMLCCSVLGLWCHCPRLLTPPTSLTSLWEVVTNLCH